MVKQLSALFVAAVAASAALAAWHVGVILPGVPVVEIVQGGACPKCERVWRTDGTCISAGGIVGVVLIPTVEP
jgi:hypothetical protein